MTFLLAIMMMSIFGKQEPVVRPATQAGRFYDGTAQRLSHEVDRKPNASPSKQVSNMCIWVMYKFFAKVHNNKIVCIEK